MRTALVVVIVIAACKGDEPAPRASETVPPAGSAIDAGSAAVPGPPMKVACAPAQLPPRTPLTGLGLVTPDDAFGTIGTIGTIGAGGRGFGGQPGTGPIGGGVGIGDLNGGYARPAPVDQPQLTFGELTVEGGLDKAIIRRYLRRYSQRFLYCYEKERLAKPALGKGTIRIQFVITPAGAVAAANGSGFDQEVANCVSQAIRTLEFPKPNNEAIVKASQPLTFALLGEPKRSGSRHAAMQRARNAGVIGVISGPSTVSDPRAWTPYAASAALAPADVATEASKALEQAVPIANVERCFGTATGSIRSVVRIGIDGAVLSARTSGLGDASKEACVGSALVGTKVGAPPTVTEVACDLTRGDPKPWRIAPDSYTVIEVTATEVRRDGKVIDVSNPARDRAVAHARKAPLPSDGDVSFLVIAEPEAPTPLVTKALMYASTSAATVLAMRSGGAVTFIAMGTDGRTSGPGDVITIDTRGEQIQACGKAKAGAAALGEVDAMFASLCTAEPCANTLRIGGSDKLTVKDLAALADAARRAGFARILIANAKC